MEQTAQSRLNITSASSVPISLQIAGVGSRSYAFVIDWHIRALLAVAWFVMIWVIGLAIDNVSFSSLLNSGTWIPIIIFLPPTIIYFLYHPILEILMHGRTPGKRMTGIRLVNTKGETPTTGAIIIRNVFRLIDGLPALYALGFCFAMFTKNHMRIGDLAAGTLLVFDNKPRTSTAKYARQLVTDSNMSLQDQELLVELLERWKQLNSKTRVSLAQQFLRRVGVERKYLDEKLLEKQLRELAGQ